MTEKRYLHTLSVYDECVSLAKITDLSAQDTNKLCIAALCHDITKEKNLDEQIEFCRVNNINLSDDDLASPLLLHSITGGEYARQLFPHIVSDEIVSIIRTHTTGSENMNLLQKILFLADFIEKTRTYEKCIEVRNYLYDNKDECNIFALIDTCCVKSLNSTINNLLTKGLQIHPDTIKARNFLLMKSEVTK